MRATIGYAETGIRPAETGIRTRAIIYGVVGGGYHQLTPMGVMLSHQMSVERGREILRETGATRLMLIPYDDAIDITHLVTIDRDVIRCTECGHHYRLHGGLRCRAFRSAKCPCSGYNHGMRLVGGGVV